MEVEGRPSSRLKSGSKHRRLGAMATSSDWWKVVKFPSADTGPEEGRGGAYTHFSDWDNSMTNHGTGAVERSIENSASSAAWSSFLHLCQVGEHHFLG